MTHHRCHQAAEQSWQKFLSATVMSGFILQASSLLHSDSSTLSIAMQKSAVDQLYSSTCLSASAVTAFALVLCNDQQ